MIAFNEKTVEELQEELYNNHKGNKDQIKSLIDSLAPLIKDSADASVLVPLLSQYLGMYIKNDELLLKLINTIKKGTEATVSTEEKISLSESERDELIGNYKESMGLTA